MTPAFLSRPHAQYNETLALQISAGNCRGLGWSRLGIVLELRGEAEFDAVGALWVHAEG